MPRHESSSAIGKQSFSERFRNWRDGKRLLWRRRLLRWVGRASVYSATLEARARLRGKSPISVLVDTSVLRHGVTHETAWVSSGIKKWGDVEIDTGEQVRIPVHSASSETPTYQEVRYLPGIADLGRRGAVALLTSAELRCEQTRQPIGRFSGYYLSDYSVFDGINMKSVDGHHLDLVDPEKVQLQRVASCSDPLFQAMLASLGQGNSLDTYHLYTAERFGIPYFLVMDFRFKEKLAKKQADAPIVSLKTKCVTPSELAAELGIKPVDTYLLSYDRAPFGVREDLFVAGERRTEPENVVQRDAERRAARKAGRPN